MSLLSLGAVTVDGYRLRSGDNTSEASACSAALLEAEALLDEELRRHLALAERTDTFPIYPDGRIYPDAYPITVSTQTIAGRALLGSTLDGGPFIGFYEPTEPYRATVTWTGGFDANTLPKTLARAIYDLAHFGLSGAAPLLVGATSASVGDVSVTFPVPLSGDLDTAVPGLTSRVRRYRNRWVV